MRCWDVRSVVADNTWWKSWTIRDKTNEIDHTTSPEAPQHQYLDRLPLATTGGDESTWRLLSRTPTTAFECSSARSLACTAGSNASWTPPERRLGGPRRTRSRSKPAGDPPVRKLERFSLRQTILKKTDADHQSDCKHTSIRQKKPPTNTH